MVDESSIVDRGVESTDSPSRGVALDTADMAETFDHVDGPHVDLSEPPPALTPYRTPTPQEVDHLLGDDAPFEATLSDRDIRRALAEMDATAADALSSGALSSSATTFGTTPVDVSLTDFAPQFVNPISSFDSAVPRPPLATNSGRVSVDETLLTERVLSDVNRQVDALFEHRLRLALAPLLAQVADAFAAEAREVLASSLRDIVAEAVAHEIERQRGR